MHVEPVVTQLHASAPGHMTVRIGIKLLSKAKNVYTMYGDQTTALTMPPAYQAGSPFGANIGGVNPGFVKFRPAAAFDSWLTVGPTSGNADNAISSIGATAIQR